jgi:Flp pilus assembly protein TadG
MRSRRNTTRRRHSRGQALVEFALIIPIFLTVFFAIVEFSFLFTSYLSVGFASHDAVQMAATYGNTAGADTAVLQRVDNDVTTPANAAKIKTVTIFWVDTSTPNASSKADEIYTYDGGSHPFTMPDGTTVYLPFVQTLDNYPYSKRCNVNGGVSCLAGHSTVDTIGVKITYQYTWITPFPALIGGSGNGPLITQINIMRLEPVL